MRLFAHKLAERRGIASVKGLLKELDSEEISELMAFDQHVQPHFDPHWGFGMLASTICNMLSGKDARRVTPQEFIPRYAMEEDLDLVEERNLAILNRKVARQKDG